MLGTLAASYLCVTVIVKYCLMESQPAPIPPDSRQGSVTPARTADCVRLISVEENFALFFRVASWGSMFSVVPTICFGFQVEPASAFKSEGGYRCGLNVGHFSPRSATKPA